MVVNLLCAVATVIPPLRKIDFGEVTRETIAETSRRENFDHKRLLERGLPTSPAPLDMEAFHLLSRGGVKFDKQKYRDDVRLFVVSIVISISQQSNCSRS